MVHSTYMYALLTFNLICSIEAMKEFVGGDSMGDAYGVEVEDKGEKLTVSLGEDESGHEEIQVGAHNGDVALVEVTASGALKTMADEANLAQENEENQCFSCVSQGKAYCRTCGRGPDCEKCYSLAEAGAHGCGGSRISPPLRYVMVAQGQVSASQPLTKALGKKLPNNNPAEGIKFNFAACGVPKGTDFVDCSKVSDECKKEDCEAFCSAKMKCPPNPPPDAPPCGACQRPTELGGRHGYYCGEYPAEVKAALAKNNNTVSSGHMTCKLCIGMEDHVWCNGPPTEGEHAGIPMGTDPHTACYISMKAAKKKCDRKKLVVSKTPANKRPAGC